LHSCNWELSEKREAASDWTYVTIIFIGILLSSIRNPMDYVRITVFTIDSIYIIQHVRNNRYWIKKKKLNWNWIFLVNYRHEQDIYVRMIDSVTKQVCIKIVEWKMNILVFFVSSICSQLFMKVKIKILKCVEFS